MHTKLMIIIILCILYKIKLCTYKVKYIYLLDIYIYISSINIYKHIRREMQQGYVYIKKLLKQEIFLI